MPETNKNRLIAIAEAFDGVEGVTNVSQYGMGHINDTYLVETKGKEKYILQRINDKIFTDVDKLMQNIVGVTEYISAHTAAPKEECLRVIPTSGKPYLRTEEGCFRTYNFISAGVSIEHVPTAEGLYVSAKGFGAFQAALDGYPAETLFDSIPDFHNTAVRFKKFVAAVENDVCGRRASVQKEIDFVTDRQRYCDRVVGALNRGELPYRVTHNDTKVNNVLIDVVNMRPVTVIDLDTVMRGSILYDFGDGVRSGASTGAEDERDLTKVNFSKELYAAYAKGFVGEVGGRLTEAEIGMLHFGAILMTYECGMRFLTDYLEGDTYFKTHREGQNLDRARTQFKMVQDMEAEEEFMRETVMKYAGKRN